METVTVPCPRNDHCEHPPDVIMTVGENPTLVRCEIYQQFLRSGGIKWGGCIFLKHGTKMECPLLRQNDGR